MSTYTRTELNREARYCARIVRKQNGGRGRVLDWVLRIDGANVCLQTSIETAPGQSVVHNTAI